MNKYYAEEYQTYYPLGGMDDMRGPFDTIDEAKASFDMHDPYKVVERRCILEVKDNVITPILVCGHDGLWENLAEDESDE